MKQEHVESTTNRTLRLSFLQSILSLARCVWLFGAEEDIRLFEEYGRELCPSANFAQISDGETVQINARDVIFPLLTDPDAYRDVFHLLRESGVSREQIMAPSCFFFPILAERKGFIKQPDMSRFQLPFLATIDTVNACNLDCATCGKPAWQESGERMPFDLFVKCLDKLQRMGIQVVELYNFTEPFLNPELYRFMSEVKRRGMALGISTNLSLPHIPHLKECVDLLRDQDWFVITISGVRQEIYEINHRRGKIANVIENLKEIAKSSGKKNVQLRLLEFDYNIGELDAARRLADEHGIGFKWYPASGSPFDGYAARRERKALMEQGLSYNDYDRSFSQEGFYCFFIHSRNMVINCRGNVELCCHHTPRPYDLGSFLDQDIGVIQLKRDSYPYCHSCRYMREASEEAAYLTKVCPVNPEKASNVLRHGMEMVCLERMLSPKVFWPELRNTFDFLQRSVRYFTEVSR